MPDGLKPKVLYIAGSGRSGSTVVARYLEAAVDACHVGELRYVWSRGVDERQLCECGEPFGSCDFWHAVLAGAYPGGVTTPRERMAELTDRVDRLRRIPRNATAAHRRARSATIDAYGDCLVPLYEWIHRVSGAGLVIDSSKDPSYLFALRATGRIELSVLHLVRDSRAVAHSWTRVRKRPEVHWADQTMNVVSPSRSARGWIINNLAVELFSRVEKNVTRVRYEDFAQDPGSCLDRMVDSLQLVRRPVPLQVAGHSFSGNPMRFDRKPLQVRADTAWTAELGPEARRTVSLLTFPLLRKYGYPLK